MGNLVIGAPDWVIGSGAGVASGSWSSSYPVSNLLNPSFASVARSANATTAATTFQFDFGRNHTMRVFAVPRHNLTQAGKFRFATFNSTPTTTLDTGWINAFPVTIPADDVGLYPMPLVFLTSTPIAVRYLSVLFDDTANPAGYIELPRVVAAGGWFPTRNAAYGASLGFEDASVVQQGLGGAEYFDVRPKRRVARISLPSLPDAEAISSGLDLQARLGTTSQLFYIADPDDAANRHRRCFLARMRTLSPLESAVFGRTSQTIELSEVIA